MVKKKRAKRRFLPETHPHLLKEWDYAKNGNLQPEGVSYGSHKKVWWVCSKCGYKWEAFVHNRAFHNKNCPACVGRVVTCKNRLSIRCPEIAAEWDCKRNCVLTTDGVSIGSHKKVWWLCSKCGYSWKAVVGSRSVNNSGCPACTGRVVVDRNRLSLLYPHLSVEWDYEKNFPATPEDAAQGSNKKVFWVCKKCGYNWKAYIYDRALGSKGCPACTGNVVTDKNNFSFLYPIVAKEWDYEKNFPFVPGEFSYGANEKVFWLCGECGYSWKASICNRTCGGRGCSVCSKGPVSKIERRWLDSLGIDEGYRQHRFKSLGGDVGIVVDAYVPKTNTVYEFLGDYWHGNPKIYPAEKINPTNKKSYGQLHQETMERIDILKENGYKVVYVWESDYDNS